MSSVNFEPITLERILERKTLRKHLGRWSATKAVPALMA